MNEPRRDPYEYLPIGHRLEVCNTLFNQGGLKIVDNSFLWGFDFFNRDFDTSEDSIANAGIFWSGLDGIVNDSVSFPKETIEEFADGIRLVKRNARRRRRNISGRAERHRDRIYELSRLGSNVANVGKRVARKFARGYSTESHLSQEGLQALQVMYPAVTKVAQNEWVSRKKDMASDCRIFTKALAAAVDNPVSILTKDYDFPRLLSAFYEQKDHLAIQYGFNGPVHEVSVVHSNNEVATHHYPHPQSGTCASESIKLDV